MYRIIQKRKYLFAFSLAVLVPGIIAISLWGLKVGIDFTGGTRFTLTFSGPRPSGPEAASLVAPQKVGQVIAQTAGAHDLVMQLPSVTNEQRQRILSAVQAKYPSASEKSFESIGPTVGKELLRRAVTATVLVLAAIVFYVSWAFRKVNVGPVPAWVYGLAAVVALFHDIFVVVGIFSILGHFFGIEIDSLFVTALLTVLGFSVHDTIVVFDRIRERLLKGHESTFEETVNVSLNQTVVRSINTSLTTLLVLSALYLFGGVTIRNFILALLIGIASGTYSSIFVASPLLVVYERWKRRR
ncbi:MAG: protein translocase subunit SecF [Candidatus Kerfeldbacteria bacterium]|nr:protein translocase subunit SecF [Candidatus Kerfeldbacteria bacterium]